MHRYWALVVLVSVVTSVVGAAEPGDSSDTSNSSATSRWFVTLSQTVFEGFEGVRVRDVPRGANGYQLSDALLSPDVGVGYSLNQNWSVESFVQLGPKSTFVPTTDGAQTYPKADFKSNFASVVIARQFRLGEKLSASTKVGVAVSSLSSRVELDADNSVSVTETSVGPVASFEVKQALTRRLFVLGNYTRYFTDEDDLNNAFKLGIQFRF